MYLRFGWVVAHVGLLGTIIIVLLCSAITLITGLSASAVATNMAIGTGGEYFLISRSVGLTIGGAIGIPLYLCRTLSVTLYCFGLAETLLALIPQIDSTPFNTQLLAAGWIIFTILVSSKSASASLKLQIPLMIMVGLSIAALTIGVCTGPQHGVLKADPVLLKDAGGFWAVLAVFFPAVTGFTAGIGLSGDLKDPQKAIPKGTILAVIAGAAVYLFIPILLAITAKVSTEDLIQRDTPVWTKIALGGSILVYPGIFGAVLSSAFGSALAGPRVLQALSRDGLAPAFLSRTSKTGQPTIATLVTGVIALSAVLLGELNTVATVVGIFFLTLYVGINLVAAMEKLVGDPSYRPTINVPWPISLLGALGSITVIFLISPPACAVALAIELTIWFLLRRKTLKANWGDVWAGLWGSLARLALYRLARQIRDPRSWRPNILVFADQIENRLGLLKMASWLNLNRGILTICDVITGDPKKDCTQVRRQEIEMNHFLEEHGFAAFGEVDVVENFEQGVFNIVQANGVGGLRANTIIFGWPRREERLESMLSIIRTLDRIGKASVIIRSRPATGPRRFQRIDVWWRGKENNGDLMMLLAYLLTLNPMWRQASIHIRTIVANEQEKEQQSENLDLLISSTRIPAQRDVIVKTKDQTVIEIMQQTSCDADVVFLGLMSPETGQEAQSAQRLLDLVDQLPTTILVRNSGPFQGQLI